MPCDQCDAATINGVPTHEAGCPNSWKDAATGEPLPWVCFNCDADYIPETKPARHDNGPCCAAL